MVLERKNYCFVLDVLEHIPGLMAIGFVMEQHGSVTAKLFSICCQHFFKKHCSSLPVMPTQICQCKTWHLYKHFVIIGLDNGEALCNLSCLLNVCAIPYCQPSCHHPSKRLFCFQNCYTNPKNLAQKKCKMSTAFSPLLVEDKKALKLHKSDNYSVHPIFTTTVTLFTCLRRIRIKLYWSL